MTWRVGAKMAPTVRLWLSSTTERSPVSSSPVSGSMNWISSVVSLWKRLQLARGLAASAVRARLGRRNHSMPKP